MATETVTITHSNEGIRFNWPGGTASVFSNAVYLAESYAVAVREKREAHEAIKGDLTTHVRDLSSLLAKDGSAEDCLAKLEDIRVELETLARVLA